MLRLRPYEKYDAKYIADWFENEYIFHQWCANEYNKYPITANQINAYYEKHETENNNFKFMAFNENGTIGHITMRFTDMAKTTLRFGFVAIDKRQRGKGLGKEMILLALDYAFRILKAETVNLGVFENNESAYRCYKSAGFKDTYLIIPETYIIFGDVWQCRELEYKSEEYFENNINIWHIILSVLH